MYGKNSCMAYSSNVRADLGCVMFTMAAPSIIRAETLGADSVALLSKDSRQESRSDFEPIRSLPSDDKEGGSALFS